MIVREVMTTKLVTIAPDDTLSHAANLLRQHQFHHLPVVRAIYAEGTPPWERSRATAKLLFYGLLTSQDIDLAVALDEQIVAGDMLHPPWQERRVAEVMHRALIRVTPTTSVAAAAQLLVERGLNCLPVVVNEDTDKEDQNFEQATQTLLVGLLTRSDLLMALARSLGALEPGTEVIITLPGGDLRPLAQTLLLASELHIPVRSVLAAPLEGSVPRVATVRLGTIHPAPMLLHLQQAQIHYLVGDPMLEGQNDA
ncbi:MAG: HPP family protein [Ktedonobacteraceae bacterium]|jgi:acetoin utilization protein AcuB